MSQEFHLSDGELLLAVDGELPARDIERVEVHLAACWTCRTRKQEIDAAIGEFVRFHRGTFNSSIPPSNGPRALLKAQLTEAERSSRPRWLRQIFFLMSPASIAAAVLLAGTATVVFYTRAPRYIARNVAVTVPNPNFTPGAAILVNRREVCSEASVKNKAVPLALQRKVFAEYGIASAEPGAYEVDYLITPALGGADDIHNLWPESNRATIWNARVKDALEDRLRDLVCDGQLDLATAQHDIAGNWIESYKKYFHTDQPLTSSR